MRQSPLATGFHRVGLILAVPTAICGFAMLILTAFSSTPEVPGLIAGAILVAALVLYAASWAIGWAVRGFTGEVAAKPIPVSLGAAAIPSRPVEPLVRQQSAVKDLEGFSGWLILPALGTVAAPFLIGIQTAGLFDIIAKATDTSSLVYKFIYGEILFNFFIAAVYVFAIFLMVKKRKKYPRAFIVALSLSTALAIIDAAIVGFVFDVKPDDETIKGIMKSVFGMMIWVPYMLRSKRVANTFVN